MLEEASGTSVEQTTVLRFCVSKTFSISENAKKVNNTILIFLQRRNLIPIFSLGTSYLSSAIESEAGVSMVRNSQAMIFRLMKKIRST